MTFRKSQIKTDEKFILTQAGTEEPIPHRRYSVVRTEDGSVLSSGVTDTQGHTDINKGTAMDGIKIIVHPEDGAAA